MPAVYNTGIFETAILARHMELVVLIGAKGCGKKYSSEDVPELVAYLKTLGVRYANPAENELKTTNTMADMQQCYKTWGFRGFSALNKDALIKFGIAHGVLFADLKKVTKPKKAAPVVVESDSEEEVVKEVKKVTKSKKAPVVKSDSEEEEEVKKVKKVKKAPVVESDSEEEEEVVDDDEAAEIDAAIAAEIAKAEIAKADKAARMAKAVAKGVAAATKTTSAAATKPSSSKSTMSGVPKSN